jgi:hypothetical protein
MIKSYLLNAKFQEQNFNDFKEILGVVEENRKKLSDLKLDLIIEFLSRLGRKIITDKTVNSLPGVSYLSLWLRRDNLKKMCKLNYLDGRYVENFENTENNFKLRAQPRGVVCHWIAGNMPTLAFFSLMQSILSKNGSIVKIPEHNKDVILSILRNLGDIEVVFEGEIHSGKEILRSLSIVSFDHNDYEASKDFSLAADCKIIWGGEAAVKAIYALPQKEHCEVISFGPKYSFGVFDREYIESGDFEKALDNSVVDVVLFNQMACSSPHVLFFEKSRYPIEKIGEIMKNCFEKLPEKFLRQNLPEGTATNIINIRGIYLLEDDKKILKSDDLGWTILINKDVKLEEPVQGKVIFVKEVDDVSEVVSLITRKIQAMIVCITDRQKREEFANDATYRGVDRIVVPGRIHDFSLPWDGILTLNRLVRWVILKDK